MTRCAPIGVCSFAIGSLVWVSFFNIKSTPTFVDCENDIKESLFLAWFWGIVEGEIAMQFEGFYPIHQWVLPTNQGFYLQGFTL